MSALVINNIEVSLISKDGKVFATSLDVAKVFEKEHKNVLRDVSNMSERARLNFELKSYLSLNNKEMPMYEMNRDGFSFLVMGFTGEKAENFKLDFIDGFNQMENALREQQSMVHLTPQSFTMKAIAEMANSFLGVENQIKEVKGEIAELKNSTTIDYAQQQKIQKQIAIRVAELRNTHSLESSYQRKIFQGLHRVLKEVFQVGSYKDIAKVRFNEAIHIIQNSKLNLSI